jgi:aminopeptidase N
VPRLDAPFEHAMRAALRDPQLDAAFKELLLSLPSEGYIAEQLDVVDPPRIHAARVALRLALAGALRDDWAWAFETHQVRGGYSPEAAPAGRRALSNLALTMLCLDEQLGGDGPWAQRALQRVKDAANLTDRLGALGALLESRSALAEPALQCVYDTFRDETLVIDKWFACQAGMPEHDGQVFARVRQLARHADFSMSNPNRARSLIGVFCQSNPGAFHRADAAGYVFWADRVLEMDALNPQIAARFARALERWSVLAEPYRGAAREAVARVAAKPDLSRDVREIVEHALRTPA